MDGKCTHAHTPRAERGAERMCAKCLPFQRHCNKCSSWNGMEFFVRNGQWFFHLNGGREGLDALRVIWHEVEWIVVMSVTLSRHFIQRSSWLNRIVTMCSVGFFLSLFLFFLNFDFFFRSFLFGRRHTKMLCALRWNEKSKGCHSIYLVSARILPSWLCRIERRSHSVMRDIWICFSLSFASRLIFAFAFALPQPTAPNVIISV